MMVVQGAPGGGLRVSRQVLEEGDLEKQGREHLGNCCTAKKKKG
jgi:hypothetical protein